MAFNVDLTRKQQEKLFENGEWKSCRRSGCRVLLYPPDLPDFKKTLRAKIRKAKHDLGMVGRKADQNLPDERFETVLLESVAETLMGGWEDIVDQDMNPIPFSGALAKTFLEDAKLAMFREDVLELVNAMGEYEQVEREVLSGN